MARIWSWPELGYFTLRGLGVARGRISRFPIDLRRRPYNTLAPQCECVMRILSVCSAAKLFPSVILTILMLLVLSRFSHAAASVDTCACLQGIVYVCGLCLWSRCVVCMCVVCICVDTGRVM